MSRAFVITERGDVLVQIEDPSSQWGFQLASDDMTWDGGFGSGAGTWQVVDYHDPRISDEDHDRLDWLLEE